MGNKHFNYSKQFKKEAPQETVVENPVDTSVEVQPEVQTEVEVPQAPSKKGVVIGCDHLRVRVQPNGEVMKTVDKGDEVTVLETLEGWYKVNVKGVNGYCMSQFIELR